VTPRGAARLGANAVSIFKESKRIEVNGKTHFNIDGGNGKTENVVEAL
jgi:hypothetical protein